MKEKLGPDPVRQTFEDTKILLPGFLCLSIKDEVTTPLLRLSEEVREWGSAGPILPPFLPKQKH